MIIFFFNSIGILCGPPNTCKEVFCEIKNTVSYCMALSIGADFCGGARDIIIKGQSHGSATDELFLLILHSTEI
jgi:hypothetical protein